MTLFDERYDHFLNYFSHYGVRGMRWGQRKRIQLTPQQQRAQQQREALMIRRAYEGQGTAASYAYGPGGKRVLVAPHRVASTTGSRTGTAQLPSRSQVSPTSQTGSGGSKRGGSGGKGGSAKKKEGEKTEEEKKKEEEEKEKKGKSKSSSSKPAKSKSDKKSKKDQEKVKELEKAAKENEAKIAALEKKLSNLQKTLKSLSPENMAKRKQVVDGLIRGSASYRPVPSTISSFSSSGVLSNLNLTTKPTRPLKRK